MTIEEQQKQQLDKEIMRVVKKARRHSWNRTALEDAFEKALGSLEAPAVILSDDEEEEEEEEEELEEEQTTPLRHFKKDRIGPKERKKPIPWTEDDEEFLVDLICKQGAKWVSNVFPRSFPSHVCTYTPVSFLDQDLSNLHRS